MTESLRKWLDQKEISMYVSNPTCRIIFADTPSADTVARILAEGYVEVTDTEKGNKLIETYDADQKHGLGKNRVFVCEDE